MPPNPSPPTLTSVHTLLSSLRSGIFQTAHNPTAARTGAKYLRRRLVGPSAVRYYPRMPKLSTLNALVPWNEYGNWQGENAARYRERVIASGSSGQRAAWAGKDTQAQVSESGSQPGSSADQESGSTKTVRWATAGNVLYGNQVVPEGWNEVTRIRGAGWLDDAAERVRVEEVEQKRATGRGPPKKGERDFPKHGFQFPLG